MINTVAYAVGTAIGTGVGTCPGVGIGIRHRHRLGVRLGGERETGRELR